MYSAKTEVTCLPPELQKSVLFFMLSDYMNRFLHGKKVLEALQRPEAQCNATSCNFTLDTFAMTYHSSKAIL